MTVQQIQRYLRHRPFQPFAVHLADSRVLEVAHPELMVMSTSGRTADIFSGFDLFETVDCFLIVSLRNLTEVELRGLNQSFESLPRG